MSDKLNKNKTLLLAVNPLINFLNFKEFFQEKNYLGFERCEILSVIDVYEKFYMKYIGINFMLYISDQRKWTSINIEHSIYIKLYNW